MPIEPPHLPPAGTIFWQLAIVLALVLVNGFFVASEFALVAVRRTRIDQLAAEGSRNAAIVQRALRDLDRYIAATQVGITIASLLLGGIGEPALHHILHPLFHQLGLPARGTFSSAIVATGLAYFIMTALHVIIGELMPKGIALQKPEATSLWIARPILLCGKLFTPLVWLLNGIGNYLLRRIGIISTGEHGAVHSPEELDLLFTQSHEGGQLSATEREILHRVVKFSDLTAREVMVPRVEMQGLPVDMMRRDLVNFVYAQPHTRVPVYSGSLDDVVGIAHLKDLVRFVATLDLDGDADATVSLSTMVREAPRVPETITIDRLLIEFKKRGQQMAIVIDEYGGTAGLLTMGDLLQQVFGEVRDEFDAQVPEVQVRSDGRVALPGKFLIDEANDRFGLGFPDDEADTMAGLVLGALGRPAVVGDEVEIHGANLRVEAIDRLRITALSIELPHDEQRREKGGESVTTVSATSADSPAARG
ncbi:MAG TPA: hemolysin family protein [Abditibacteriaceae bacterium]|jgi:CBS domain containing-hemolysin-like protein